MTQHTITSDHASLRVVFVGTVDFSAHCLRELIALDAHIVGVFALPPAPKRFNSDYTDLEPIARAARIPFFPMKKVSHAKTEAQILELKPDVIFVFGLSQLISTRLLSEPRLGCIGTHPALLPKNRGRHPLIWPVVSGESQSGLSFFFMNEGVDDGDLLWQQPFDIHHDDDASTLYEKCKIMATRAIRSFFPTLVDGTYSRTPQNHDDATVRRKRGERDGQLEWDQRDAMGCYNLIRALTRPYVGAHTFTQAGGARILLWKAEPLEHESSSQAETSPPGVITAVDEERGSFCVSCFDSTTLRVLKWEAVDEPDWAPRVGESFDCPAPINND